MAVDSPGKDVSNDQGMCCHLSSLSSRVSGSVTLCFCPKVENSYLPGIGLRWLLV